MEPRFEDGVWLGVEARTGEVRVGTPSGVVKSRSIRRKIEAEKWSVDSVENVVGFPWDPAPGSRAKTGNTIVDAPGQDDGTQDQVGSEAHEGGLH